MPFSSHDPAPVPFWTSELFSTAWLWFALSIETIYLLSDLLKKLPILRGQQHTPNTMISTAHHHYSPMFSPLPSDLQPFSNGMAHSQRIQTSGLETLGHGSSFALQHMHPLSLPTHSIGPAPKNTTRSRHHPYDNSHIRGKDSRQRSLGSEDKAMSGPVRRRISRACDQCNQLRTKCDGMSPCAHCIGRLGRFMVKRYEC